MSEGEPTEEAPKKGVSLILLIAVAVVALGMGAATPIILAQLSPPEEDDQEVEQKADEPTAPAFISFGELVANIDDPSFSRYVKVDFSIQVDEKEKLEAEVAIDKNKILIKNWLLTYFHSQKLPDIRGAANHNRLRREIAEYLNAQLYDDGIDHVQGILFEEFNIQ